MSRNHVQRLFSAVYFPQFTESYYITLVCVNIFSLIKNFLVRSNNLDYLEELCVSGNLDRGPRSRGVNGGGGGGGGGYRDIFEKQMRLCLTIWAISIAAAVARLISFLPLSLSLSLSLSASPSSQ